MPPKRICLATGRGSSVLTLFFVAALCAGAPIGSKSERGYATSEKASGPECGVWAVKRACDILGQPVTMEQVQNLMPPNKRGHSMLDVSKSLAALGFETQGLRTSYERLASGLAPAIAHMEPFHFFLVVNADKEDVSGYDGSVGLKRIGASDFQSKWSGLLLTIKRPEINAPQSGQPLARWQTLLVDKGDVTKAKSPLIYTYEFQNAGDKDLIVEKVTTDCSCLSVEIPEEPVALGKSGAIILRYNSKENSGEFAHTAVVKTNDAVHPTITLVAMGKTGEAGWRVEPSAIRMGGIVAGAERHALLCVYPPKDGPWKFTSFESQVEDIAVQCREIDRKALVKVLPDSLKRVRLSLPCKLFHLRILASSGEAGYRQGELRLFLENAPIKSLAVPFYAEITAPVKVLPQVVLLQ